MRLDHLTSFPPDGRTDLLAFPRIKWVKGPTDLQFKIAEMKKIAVLPLVLLLAFLLNAPTLATDQPMADKIVGYWVSSSGTPLSISYSGDPQKVWLSIDGGSNIDVWLSTGRDGKLYLYYVSPDGSEVEGDYNEGNGTINVASKSGPFTATWKRS